jgi:cell division septation protein DedD
MGKKGSEQIERYNVGFFQSLTPASYVLLILVTAGMIVGTSLLFFRGGEGVTSTLHQVQPEVPSLVQVAPHDPLEPAVEEKSPEFLALEADGVEAQPSTVNTPLLEQGEWRAEITPLIENTSQGVDSDPNGSDSEDVQATIKAEAFVEPQAQSMEGNVSETTPSAPAVRLSEEVASLQPAKDQGHWIVQLSVNKNPDLAYGWAKRLQGLGANAYVLDRRTDSGDLHFLRIGFFASREEARSMADEITGKVGLSGYALLEASLAEHEQFAPLKR